MLDWMKGVMGKKASPVQKLAAGEWADDAEKQAMLGVVANDTSIKGEELVPLVLHKDAGVQQRASALFVARATDSSAAFLLDQAVDGDAQIRANALKTLVRVKADLLKGAVEGILKETAQDRLRSAWEVTMGLPAELSDSYLDRALTEGPPPARVAALDRILKSRPIESSRAQVIGAASDRDARVRKTAVAALASLEGNDVFEAMLDRLAGEDNAEIRNTAGSYLQKFIATAPAEMRPTIMGRLLLSGDASVQGTLLKALFASGNPSQLLFEILTFGKTILGVQHANIMTSLTSMGDGLLDEALKLLSHEDADIRIQALLLVEKFANPKSASATVKLLGDPDWWVRIMACEALGRLKDQRVIPYLQKLLTDGDAKWAAMEAIGAIGGESAFATLLGLFRDAQPEVRLAAMNAAAKLTDSRVESYVTDISKSDPAMDLRIRAVEILRSRKAGGDAGSTSAITSAQLSRPMEKLLAFARESGASDLHVTPGEPPILRINGALVRLKSNTLSAQQTDQLLDEILDPVRKPILETAGHVDYCYSIAGVGRYRVNIFRMNRGLGAAFRAIPNVAPTLSELGLPKHLDEVNTFHQGIVLLTGPAGSGKSTSLTALVNLVNESRNAHVLTLEDPIEFLHSPKKALINQREIGRDSKTFAASMRAALREDPDVIVVGEMRDPETIRLALLAAETGHLVIATMQTTGAVATIDKLVESFPADEQQQVRVGLAGSLKLIVSQSLVPKADGRGRVAVFEILKSTSPIRAIIREGKTFQLPSAMQIGRSQGMVTVDASLEELVHAGVISLDVAYERAEKKDTFTAKGMAAKKAAPSAPGSAPEARAAAPRAPQASAPSIDGAEAGAGTPKPQPAAEGRPQPPARPQSIAPAARPQQPGAARPQPQARPQGAPANPAAKPGGPKNG
ncbi:MAG: PilT/PilU family type 4a pilus ATPase [Polyangiaceae bacterium]